MQTPKKYNFTRLDAKQQALLTNGGWSRGSGQKAPGRRNVQKLLDRGLLEVHSQLGLFDWYTVPADVAAAWLVSPLNTPAGAGK